MEALNNSNGEWMKKVELFNFCCNIQRIRLKVLFKVFKALVLYLKRMDTLNSTFKVMVLVIS